MTKIFLSLVTTVFFVSCTSTLKVKNTDISKKESKLLSAQDEALQKNDPILEELHSKELKESPLLEKIILQMLEKKKRKKDSSIDKNKNEKTNSEDSSILTPDSLLNEI